MDLDFSRLSTTELEASLANIEELAGGELEAQAAEALRTEICRRSEIPRWPLRACVEGSGDRPGEVRRPPGAGWANEPLSLRALAVALEHLVGTAPSLDDGYTDALAAWFERYGRAADVLAEVSNRDAGALRSVAGPIVDDETPRELGCGLLVAAAIVIERRHV